MEGATAVVNFFADSDGETIFDAYDGSGDFNFVTVIVHGSLLRVAVVFGDNCGAVRVFGAGFFG